MAKRKTAARSASARPRDAGVRRVRAVVVLSAYPRRGAAERAARALVRDRVVACATVTTSARAVYFWKGKEVSERSVLLWGKTTASRVGDAMRQIRASHPDKIPEILVLKVEAGDPGYLRWLEGEVTSPRTRRAS